MVDKNPRHEYLDDTPIALPLKFRRQSFIDQMRAFVQQELSRQAHDQGAESFEESDDFWIEDEDDPLPRTRYELDDNQLYYAPEPEPDPAPGSPTPPSDPAAAPSEPGTEAG